MRTFFLFYLLNSLFRSPLMALIVIGAIIYFSEARYSGRYFNPIDFTSKRRAVSELQRAVEINEHDVASHNDLGRLLADEGRFADGAVHMAKAIERMDESAETNFYHGLCLIETGRAADGVPFIERAIEINPRYGYGRAHVVLCRRAYEAGDHERAESWGKEAVKLNTSSVEGWVALGEAQAALGNAADAKASFERAQEAYRDLPHYMRLAEKKWLKEAKAAARRM